MSIKLMSLIWEDHTGQLSASEKSVLIRMADFAADDGSSIYPGYTRIGKDTSLSYETVKRSVWSLMEKGYLIKVKNENRWSGKAAVFQINVKKLEESKQLSLKPKPVDNSNRTMVTETIVDPTLVTMTIDPGHHDHSTMVTMTTHPSSTLLTITPPTPIKSIPVENKKERDLKINKLEEELRHIFPKNKLSYLDTSAIKHAIDRFLEPEDVIAAAREYIRHERENNQKGKFIQQLRNWLNHYKLEAEENYISRALQKLSPEERYVYASMK